MHLEQAVLQRRGGHAGAGVGVHDALVDGVRHVDGGVDHESGAVYRVVRLTHHVSVDVDPHEARGGNLLVAESVGIDEERRRFARNAYCQVPVDELGPPEVLDEPVRGGELDPELAFDGRGVVRVRMHGG